MKLTDQPDVLVVRAIDYASPNGDRATWIEMELQPDGSYRIVREFSEVNPEDKES